MHIRTRSQLQNGATLVAQSIGERAATADRDRLCGAASLSRRGWDTHPSYKQTAARTAKMRQSSMATRSTSSSAGHGPPEGGTDAGLTACKCNKPTRTRGRKPLNLASLRLLSRGLADSHVAGDPGMRDGRGWADRLLAAAAHLPGAHLWSGQARHPTPSRHRARTEGASTRTCTHVRRCCKRVHVWPRALTCIDPLGSRRRKNGIGRLWL